MNCLDGPRRRTELGGRRITRTRGWAWGDGNPLELDDELLEIEGELLGTRGKNY